MKKIFAILGAILTAAVGFSSVLVPPAVEAVRKFEGW